MCKITPYQVIFLDKSNENINEEDFNKLIKNTEILKFNRGHFLDYIIQIELIIDIVIENYLLHKKSTLKNVFRKNILNNRAIGLSNKMELLYEIIHEKEDLSNDDLIKLKKCLNFLRSERNKWAHGTIRFIQKRDRNTLKYIPNLIWISKGSEKYLELSEIYLNELVNKLKINKEILIKILKKRELLSRDFKYLA